jgi:hypothetical protein
MGFLNKKPTCFTPCLSLEQTGGKLQEKIIKDVNGTFTLRADNNFDGMASVKVFGLYYTGNGEPYAKVMHIEKDFESRFNEAEELETLYFCNCKAGAYVLRGYANCPKLRELHFIDNCNVKWTDVQAFFGSFENIETITIQSVSNDAEFLDYVAFYGCTALKEFSVYAGWDKAVTLSQSLDLTPQSIVNLIYNAATVTNGQYMDLGYENVQKVSEDIIDIALSKGWDVY